MGRDTRQSPRPLPSPQSSSPRQTLRASVNLPCVDDHTSQRYMRMQRPAQPPLQQKPVSKSTTTIQKMPSEPQVTTTLKQSRPIPVLPNTLPPRRVEPLAPLKSISAPASLKRPVTSKSGPRTHVKRTVVWFCVALAVAVVFALFKGRQRALEFVAGYIVEYSLSVDNLFVFLLIFKYFKVPQDAQESVLFWGILGAMVLRGLMVVCGKALVQRFEWFALAFAALLIYSAGKLMLEDDDDESDLETNRVIRFSKTVLPVADKYSAGRFFVVENGRLLATPLMVVLVAIELSDVIFALDSVPAVLGLSNDTFVIYVSNILAIMGLRSLFFVLATCIGNLRFLKQALSIVLVFIGVKMIAGCLGYDIGIAFSLGVVALTLGGGIGLSIALPSSSKSNSSEDLPSLVANNV